MDSEELELEHEGRTNSEDRAESDSSTIAGLGVENDEAETVNFERKEGPLAWLDEEAFNREFEESAIRMAIANRYVKFQEEKLREFEILAGMPMKADENIEGVRERRSDKFKHLAARRAELVKLIAAGGSRDKIARANILKKQVSEQILAQRKADEEAVAQSVKDRLDARLSEGEARIQQKAAQRVCEMEKLAVHQLVRKNVQQRNLMDQRLKRDRARSIYCEKEVAGIRPGSAPVVKGGAWSPLKSSVGRGGCGRNPDFTFYPFRNDEGYTEEPIFQESKRSHDANVAMVEKWKQNVLENNSRNDRDFERLLGTGGRQFVDSLLERDETLERRLERRQTSSRNICREALLSPTKSNGPSTMPSSDPVSPISPRLEGRSMCVDWATRALKCRSGREAAEALRKHEVTQRLERVERAGHWRAERDAAVRRSASESALVLQEKYRKFQRQREDDSKGAVEKQARKREEVEARRILASQYSNAIREHKAMEKAIHTQEANTKKTEAIEHHKSSTLERLEKQQQQAEEYFAEQSFARHRALINSEGTAQQKLDKKVQLEEQFRTKVKAECEAKEARSIAVREKRRPMSALERARLWKKDEGEARPIIAGQSKVAAVQLLPCSYS